MYYQKERKWRHLFLVSQNPFLDPHFSQCKQFSKLSRTRPKLLPFFSSQNEHCFLPKSFLHFVQIAPAMISILHPIRKIKPYDFCMRNLNNTFRNPTPSYITVHASIQSHSLHKSSSDSLGSASHVTQIGSHFASETFRWFKVYFGYMIKGGCIGVGFEWGVGFSTLYLNILRTWSNDGPTAKVHKHQSPEELGCSSSPLFLIPQGFLVS